MSGGGRLSFVLTDSVTKAILGENISPVLISALECHPVGVSFLNLTWVIDSLFSASPIISLLKSRSPFQDADIDFDRILTMDDLCNCYNIRKVVNPLPSNDFCLMPPPMKHSSVKRSNSKLSWLTEDTISSIGKRKQSSLIDVRTDLLEENAHTHTHLNSKRSKISTKKEVDLNDESQIVLYRNSSLLNL